MGRAIGFDFPYLIGDMSDAYAAFVIPSFNSVGGGSSLLRISPVLRSTTKPSVERSCAAAIIA